MKNIRIIFLTILVMTLSMTIISAQETSQETQEESILEEDIQTEIDEAATEEVAADEATTDEAATDEAAEEVAADENSEDSKDGVLESEEVPESEEVSITEEVPAFVGVEELSEAYQVELDAATQEGYMPIDILIQRGYLKMDVDAFIYMDTTYVSLRPVAEAFGLTDIMWDEENLVATVSGRGHTLQFLLNTSDVVVNGQVQSIGSPIVLFEERMMVPLKFFTELLDFEVIWDQTYYTVGLIHPTIKVDAKYMDNRFYTYDELQNFAKLVMLESGDTSYEVHHGVASVVMNRMSHKYFGSSVDGVIFNREWAVQFPPAHKSSFDETKPNEKAIKAVKYTLRGQNSVDTCIFFNTRPFKGKTIYKVVDGVYFMKD